MAFGTASNLFGFLFTPNRLFDMTFGFLFFCHRHVASSESHAARSVWRVFSSQKARKDAGKTRDCPLSFYAWLV
jgi:hypothetical protein